MSPTIRIREPIEADPPEWTIEWFGVMGDGAWMLLRNGCVHSTYTWKWQARLARRGVSNQDRDRGERDPAKRPS